VSAGARSDTPALAVVIVCHDSGATLAECVTRVANAAAVTRLVLVDNASADGAPERAVAIVGSRLPVELLRNPDNPGFGTACNQGARAAGAVDWLCFLNPDCLVEPDSFVRLLAIGAADPSLALLGADVVDGCGQPEPAARRNDPDLRRILASMGIVRRTGDAGALHRERGDEPVQAVDAPSGALLLVRRSAYAAIGGFDPAYRLHAEDLDLARRLRQGGGRVAVANAVRVVHIKGTSSVHRPWFVAWNKHRGLTRYFLKFGAGGSWATPLAIAGVWLKFVLGLPRLVRAAARSSATEPGRHREAP
jgi:hypothetical protein